MRLDPKALERRLEELEARLAKLEGRKAAPKPKHEKGPVAAQKEPE